MSDYEERIKAWYMSRYKGIWDGSQLHDYRVMSEWANHLESLAQKDERAFREEMERKLMMKVLHGANT